MTSRPVCGRRYHTELGDECVFHRAEGKETFLEEFQRLIDEGKKGPLDCTGFVFPALTLHQIEFQGTVWFHECRFTGKTMFQEITFHNGAAFFGSQFESSVSFHKSLLRGQATFQSATFAGAADFGGCQFEGACDFYQTRFLDQAHFASARFVATMRDRQPFGYFVFIEAAFQGPTDFSLATFEGNTTFRGARFGDVALFSHLSLGAPRPAMTLTGGTSELDPSLDFSNVRVDRTDGVRFSGPAHPPPGSDGQERRPIERPLDLSGVRFHGADVARMQFMDVIWGPAPGGRARARRRDMGAVFDQGERGSLQGWFVWNGDRAAGERLALIYKGLRESYERHLLFAEAGRFHVREMECRRRVHGSWAHARAFAAPSSLAVRAWMAVAAMRRQVNLLNAYRLTSNYGESYVRAFWSIAAWFILVAAFERWLRPLWFSQPLGWPHELVNQAIVLMPAQVAGDSLTDFVGRLVGVFLIAGFIIALRRHFRR